MIIMVSRTAWDRALQRPEGRRRRPATARRAWAAGVREAVFMDFAPNPLHEEIRSAVGELCERFPDEYWSKHDESKEYPWDFWQAIADAGWFGLTAPKEYGGGGLGV